ncbi:hypothetical protein PFTANZ_06352, partial [Plasmodium falciparum Tanzania (2000708)]
MMDYQNNKNSKDDDSNNINNKDEKDKNDIIYTNPEISLEKIQLFNSYNIPFLRLVDNNFRNCKNYDFCKSLSSSNESSMNSNISYIEREKDEDLFFNEENITKTEPLINEDDNTINKNDSNKKNESNNKKKEKKSENAYEFLYFKGRLNVRRQKDTDKNKTEANKKKVDNETNTVKNNNMIDQYNSDSNFIKENDLKDYYFKKREKKNIFIQLNSRNGILHKKKKINNNNNNNNNTQLNNNSFNNNEEFCDINNFINNKEFLKDIKQNNLYDSCYVEIPTLQKKITFDENINNDIYNYLFNFNCFTLNVLNFYNHNISVTNVFYNIFKVGLCLHPLCYVNSFKNFSLLYNYLINTNLSLFILIRSLNILKNDKINKIIYSLIFGEQINECFLHKILSNELKDPYFYAYFFDAHKKMNINKNTNDDMEFEDIYTSSINYLLPEYNKEEEASYLNLINKYYKNMVTKILPCSKENGKGEQGEKEDKRIVSEEKKE